MRFTTDLDRFAEKAGLKSEKTFRATCLLMLGAIVKRTPVDTGRAKGNWQASIGRPDRGQTSALDKSGSATVNKASSVVSSLKLGHVFYLSNNLPYITDLENGTSKQAPHGMVRLTVAEYEKYVERAAK